MTAARALWAHLTPDAQRWFGEIRRCVTAQPLDERWTVSRQQQALSLLAQLELAWHQERVDLEALLGLEQVSGELSLAAAVSCRVSLEAVRGHLMRLLESTYDALAQGD
jgi:hypothetical protein